VVGMLSLSTVKALRQVVTLTMVCVPDGPNPVLTTLTGWFVLEELLHLEQDLLQIIQVQVTVNILHSNKGKIGWKTGLQLLCIVSAFGYLFLIPVNLEIHIVLHFFFACSEIITSI